ncbi:MAG: type II secretion system protein [Phycisphaerales bacterium]
MNGCWPCNRGRSVQQRAKGSRAFTLIELLVVIAIIATLVSILLPGLAEARRSAWNVICQNNLRQFGIAIQSYLDEQKDPVFMRLERGERDPVKSVREGHRGVNGLHWQVGAVHALQPFLGAPAEPSWSYAEDPLDVKRLEYEATNAAMVQKPFDCPVARGLTSVRDPVNVAYLQGSRYFTTPGVFQSGSASAPIVRYTEYWFNDSKEYVAINPTTGVTRASGVSFRKIRGIKNPTAVVWATDAMDEFPRHVAKRLLRDAGGASLDSVVTGQNNFLFGDASVKPLPFQDYTPRPDSYGSYINFYNWGHAYPP